MYKTFRDKEDGCIKVVLKPVRRASAWTLSVGRQPTPPTRLARGLGWFSVGLGLGRAAGAAKPRPLPRHGGHTGLIRAYGVRELAAGVGILAQMDPTPWIWGRVAGDALDMGTLAPGLRRDNPQRENVGLALIAVAGVTALDVLCATALGGTRDGDDWPHPSGTTATGAACRARPKPCAAPPATP